MCGHVAFARVANLNHKGDCIDVSYYPLHDVAESNHRVIEVVRLVVLDGRLADEKSMDWGVPCLAGSTVFHGTKGASPKVGNFEGRNVMMLA